MGKSNTTWQKGQSGNPRGGPKKNRALTAILERAGNQTLDVGGEHISGKRLIARLAWDVATKGEAILPSGRMLVVAAQDWFDVVKWIYTHIDGPVKQSMEVSGPDGGPIQTESKIDLSDDQLDREIAAAIAGTSAAAAGATTLSLDDARAAGATDTAG